MVGPCSIKRSAIGIAGAQIFEETEDDSFVCFNAHNFVPP
jgi:hypothetical protein